MTSNTNPRESCYQLQDSCGVFGCIAAEGIDLGEFGLANNIFLGLLGIQHRYINIKVVYMFDNKLQ
jgi:hypothetical protein